MSEAPATKIFARVIEIPPGAPWDQYRAARLDAVHGAPLAAGDVAFALKRLSPWRPRTSARYGVAYRRKSEPGVSDIVEVMLVGRPVRFRFPGQAARADGNLVATGVLGALAAAALLAGGLKAVEARAAKAEALTRLEARAAVLVRQDRRDRQARAEAALIRRADGEGRGFADLTSDLWWLGQVRNAEVALRRIQWSRGAMVITGFGAETLIAGAERPVHALGDAAGLRTWRIGALPPAVVRGGVTRPSIVSRPSGVGGGS